VVANNRDKAKAAVGSKEVNSRVALEVGAPRINISTKVCETASRVREMRLVACARWGLGSNRVMLMLFFLSLAVDKVASAEGIPGAADGEINKEVDQEVNNL
jgi:hypothetical protein